MNGEKLTELIFAFGRVSHFKMKTSLLTAVFLGLVFGLSATSAEREVEEINNEEDPREEVARENAFLELRDSEASNAEREVEEANNTEDQRQEDAQENTFSESRDSVASDSNNKAENRVEEPTNAEDQREEASQQDAVAETSEPASNSDDRAEERDVQRNEVALSSDSAASDSNTEAEREAEKVTDVDFPKKEETQPSDVLIAYAKSEISGPSGCASWWIGDGIGGFEEKIGRVGSKIFCYAICSIRRKNGVLANGATVDTRTKRYCYCEYGMKKRNSVKKWTSTFIIRGASKWSSGDGIGGTEVRVYGTHSKEDCYAMCVNKKKNGVYANGATTDAKTGKICYCEFGMSKRNSVKKWKSTFIIRGKFHWSRGSGIGGTKVRMYGTYSKEDCYARCSSYKRNGVYANGATTDISTGKICYCEFGMTKRNTVYTWTSTFIIRRTTNWARGDGIGGSELNIGKVTSKEDCYAICATKTRHGVYANGATVDVKTNSQCYCEFGMNERNLVQKWTSTFILRRDTSWGIGDGTGGTEVQVGVVKSKEDCYAICSIKKLDGKLADGATIDVKTNTNCYCEFGMTKRNTNKKWTSAFIIRTPTSWWPGGSSGGTKVYIGKVTSKDDCYAMCRSKEKNGKLANGATVDTKTGKYCYCDFGMKKRSTLKKWTSTFIIRGTFKWAIGDGIGGTEVRVGKVKSKEDCYAICTYRKKNGVLANGATTDVKTNTICYCEFGMKKRNKVKKWTSTFIHRVTTSWARGDGIGGTELSIGKFASKEDCYFACSMRKKNGKYANGATVDYKTGTNCYCEFGMTKRNKVLKWTSSFIIRGTNKWTVGGGVGGIKLRVYGVFSKQDCFAMCNRQKHNGMHANGAMLDKKTRKICYCFFGMTGKNKLTKWTTTFIIRGKFSWEKGDGIGGTWVRVGIVASKADCFAICTMKVKNGILANGATVDTKTGTNCYCEFGMTKRNKVRKWSSTFIIRKTTSWAIGDGIGGTEVRVGTVSSKLDCYGICSKYMKNGVLANGATVDVKTNTICYCEFGMKKRNTNKKWTSSFIIRATTSWGIGDGIGGTEVRIGTVKSKEDCYAMCMSSMKNGVLANGATVDVKTGTNCYCEFGMKKRNVNKKWKSAFIMREPEKWITGSGIGGTQLRIYGTYSKEDCYIMCSQMKRYGVYANGATVDKKTNKICYCEFGMTKRNSVTTWTSTYIITGTLSWATGDGIGGTELRIYGISSKEDCYARCRNTKVNGVYANGATTDKKTNKLCYCEFGMTKRNAVAKWTSTFIARGKTTWAIGDGIGGTEMRIGLVASKQDCYVICSKTMKNGQLANGATIDVKTNKNCYCEFGMNKRNTNKKWTSTFIVRGTTSWAKGAGVGTLQVKIGTVKSREECYAICSIRKRNGIFANGATTDLKTGTICYCDFGMKKRNTLKKWISAFIIRKPETWITGYGIGGTKVRVYGTYSKEDCYAMCMNMVRNGKYANGATTDQSTNKICYCEFGMKKRNSLKTWTSTFLIRRTESWAIGDGIGGTEVRIYGTASKEDCFARCSLLKKSGVYANGATVDRKTGKLCYCEFGMSKRNTNKKWTSTFIIRGKTNWGIGDGIGGTEVRVGIVSSKQDCYAVCSKYKKNGVLANGATTDVKTNTICYCEFGMKKRNTNKKWTSTFIITSPEKWSTGEGVGGTQLRVYGVSSKEDCYAICKNTKKNGVYANGATLDKSTNKICYCEFGMKKRNTVTTWTSVFITRGKSTWSIGDGIGGTWVRVGIVASRADCYAICTKRTRHGFLANGATVDTLTGKNCYCEFGMTGRNKVKKWTSTFIIREKYTWGIGDGVGGTWVRVGIVPSRADCYAICRTKMKNGIYANGACVDTKTGTNCYCEFGITKRNKVKKWTTAFIIRTPEKWSTGDGIGGTEVRIYGTYSKEDCYAMCSTVKKNGVYANGATTDKKTNKLCYCEFGMTKRNAVAKWTSTYIIREPGKWSTGDGIGGTELRVYGATSKEDCYAICRRTKKNGVYANGATSDKKTGKICYCEFGMSKRNAVKKWTSTFIVRGTTSWAIGDGIGGTEVRVYGTTSKEDCYSRCRTMVKNGFYANGATVDSKTNKLCYCVFGMTKRNVNKKWTSTFIISETTSWYLGSGTGGTEVSVGKVTSKQDCYAICSRKMRNGVLANGATLDVTTNTHCYCEFGMKKRNTVKTWTSVFIIRETHSWGIGDGIGGTEVRVGIVKSKEDCYAICRTRTKNGVLANGATVDTKTGTNCYCEFGMKKRNTVKKWSSAFIIRLPGKWITGYAIGGTKVRVYGTYTPQDCYAMCSSMKRNGVYANGATSDAKTGKICYCDFGMKRRNTVTTWKSTYIIRGTTSWSTGDGIGGTEVRVGYVSSKEDCYARCSTMKKNRVLANGATVDKKTNKICYCEFGMTKRNAVKKWTSTFIVRGKSTWAIGDGIGGTEVKVGKVTSKQDCYAVCSKYSKNGVFANGATTDVKTNTICYCEFGMNKRNTLKKWTSTFIIRETTSWAIGDGIGGTWVRVGIVKSKEDCYAICRTKKKGGFLANGATVDTKTGTNCYCEFGMKKRNTVKKWSSAFIIRETTTWATGDGIRGTEVKIGGVKSKEDCYAMCSTYVKNGKLANGATVDVKTNKICYCEFGMKKRNVNKKWKSVFIIRGTTKWGIGDGIGGTEVKIGNVKSKEDCYALCSTKKKGGKLANGATVDVKTQTVCYCEFGMKKRNTVKKWMNTVIKRVYTTGGTAKGKACHFPFLYNGHIYNKCTKTDHFLSWCATTFNYVVDRKWGNCLTGTSGSYRRRTYSRRRNSRRRIGSRRRVWCLCRRAKR